MNAKFIVIDPAYCDIIVQRWIDYRKRKGLSANVTKNGIDIDEW